MGEKFDRVLGKEGDAGRYRQRLTEVVERWRSPYSHGGFEKGHGATIYLHTPGVNAAIPVGLNQVRSSPMFSFIPATETHITEVFELFDEIFRSLLAQAREENDFAGLLEFFEYRQAMIDNMGLLPRCSRTFAEIPGLSPCCVMTPPFTK
ncbi:hypothetical protein EV652_110325 [Kribbella steppae]|uniref:Uncharacterized protein n=1 Tax=Kribbella steppae TaxID=2512223 RepID=A0A4R2H7X6_9ACTN|nr:hypothetical protein [Kribbella steppae]TCO22339.1 hypothetical protein EV652_110325 [Kribbella steppae]